MKGRTHDCLEPFDRELILEGDGEAVEGPNWSAGHTQVVIELLRACESAVDEYLGETVGL